VQPRLGTTFRRGLAGIGIDYSGAGEAQRNARTQLQRSWRWWTINRGSGQDSGETYYLDNRDRMSSRSSLARPVPKLLGFSRLFWDRRASRQVGRNLSSNSSTDRYTLLFGLFLFSTIRLPEIIGEKLRIELRPEIMFPFYPNEAIAPGYDGDVNRTCNSLRTHRNLPFERC